MLILQISIVIFLLSTNVAALRRPLLNNFKLIILHNNDMHARFEQTSAISGTCKEKDLANGKCYGGFARVAHVVREYRRRANDGEIPKVLFLNAGDTYAGTPWFSLYKDNITAAFLELLKPDAISLGNHEFDEGTSNLASFLRAVDFPVLVANMKIDNVPELRVDSLKSSQVFEIDGNKIGVIGYLTNETKSIARANEVEFIDEIDPINKEAALLKQQGINIIIALGHSGIERDRQIAYECKDVDLVIGGHSHTFLYNGSAPDREIPFDTYPVTIIQRNGKKVPVVQSYAYTKYLGYLHLEFDFMGNLIEIDGNPILLDSSIPRDKDVLQLLDIYRPGILALQNEIVGVTRVFLDASCRGVECNLGNFVADSMVDWNAMRYSGDGWTDAAIGMIQGGGVRASIEKTQSGNITMEDLTTVLPFENKVVVIEVTGQSIVDALEHSVYYYTNDLRSNPEFMQLSGLQVEYDVSKEAGHRVVDVRVLCAYCSVPQLENLDVDKNYRIVTITFLANGGDGYVMFKNSQIGESEALDVEVLKDYVKKKSPIYPVVDGRIKINKMAKTSSTESLETSTLSNEILYAKNNDLKLSLLGAR